MRQKKKDASISFAYVCTHIRNTFIHSKHKAAYFAPLFDYHHFESFSVVAYTFSFLSSLFLAVTASTLIISHDSVALPLQNEIVTIKKKEKTKRAMKKKNWIDEKMHKQSVFDGLDHFVVLCVIASEKKKIEDSYTTMFVSMHRWNSVRLLPTHPENNIVELFICLFIRFVYCFHPPPSPKRKKN